MCCVYIFYRLHQFGAWDNSRTKVSLYMQQRSKLENRVFFRNHMNATSKRDSLHVVHMYSTDCTSLDHGRLLEQKLHCTCNKEGNWKNTFFFQNHMNATVKRDSLCVLHMNSTDCTRLDHGSLLEQKLHCTCNKEGNWKNTFFSKTIWTPLLNAIVYAFCIYTLPIAAVWSMGEF